MVAVTYRRWSFARGPNCKALTGKILVFWIGGCLWAAVAHRGSTVLSLLEYKPPSPHCECREPGKYIHSLGIHSVVGYCSNEI